MRDIKIFCPKCQWIPRPADRWACLPSCGCIWNTFDTCGVCPRCGKNWIDTRCLACHRWSPHVDWYHETVPDTAIPKPEAQPATLPEPAPA